MNDDSRHGQRSGIDPKRIEAAARAICEADPLSPAPDAPIMWGMKRAKAWEPRAAILRQAIDSGLFSHPAKVWLAPMVATGSMPEEGAKNWLASTSSDACAVASAVYAAMRDAHLNDKAT